MGFAVLSLFAKIVVPLFFAGMAMSSLVVVVSVVRYISDVSTPDNENVADL